MNRLLDIRSYFQKVGFAFRALQNKNFKIFFLGQLVSLMGVWIQNIALGWLVYRLTDSAVWLGVIGFAGQIPALFLTPFAGVFADRLNRRKVLIVTQIIPMAMAFTMAALILTNSVLVWHIAVVAVINGIVLAFDNPFRHSFLLEMIGDKELLQNAIALNSTLFNSARFIGPMIGGFLIALVGEGYCFLVNGVTSSAVVISLFLINVSPSIKNTEHKSVIFDLMEGAKYAFSFKPIRFLLILVLTTGFFGMPFQVFLPVFARDILGGDSQLLGFLTGALGAGALTGAVYLASRKGMKQLPRMIFFAAILFAIGLMSLSLSTNIILSLVLLYFTGFGMIVQFASTNTLIQSIVDDSKRGRIMALYGMSFLGVTPVGSLLLGAISGAIGVQITLFISSIFCLGAAALFSRRVNIVKAALEY
ncbi:MAG: MFS transporter [Bacteroidales bacterium]|nr:MFS transporter [Bacteroidales bacterium]